MTLYLSIIILLDNSAAILPEKNCQEIIFNYSCGFPIFFLCTRQRNEPRQRKKEEYKKKLKAVEAEQQLSDV